MLRKMLSKVRPHNYTKVSSCLFFGYPSEYLKCSCCDATVINPKGTVMTNSTKKGCTAS